MKICEKCGAVSVPLTNDVHEIVLKAVDGVFTAVKATQEIHRTYGGTPEQVSEKPKVPECVRELIQNHVNHDACCPCIKCCDTREAIKKVVEYYAK